MEFATRVNPPKIEAQKGFSPFRSLYEQTIDEKGHKKLIKKGKENVYEQIQMYKDDCDIYKILQRAAAGDVSVLEKRAGQYADTTNMPKTIHECFEFVQQANGDYEKLPQEIKEEFGNSIIKFAGATKEEIEKVIKKVANKGKQSQPEEPVNEQKEQPKNES